MHELRPTSTALAFLAMPSARFQWPLLQKGIIIGLSTKQRVCDIAQYMAFQLNDRSDMSIHIQEPHPLQRCPAHQCVSRLVTLTIYTLELTIFISLNTRKKTSIASLCWEKVTQWQRHIQSTSQREITNFTPCTPLIPRRRRLILHSHFPC